MMDAQTHLEVLLIEDNPGDIALIEALLLEAGAGAVTLHSAHRLSEGLELLRRTALDVVLLDLSLPDSDGLGTLARARQENPGVPFLILTGLDDAETGAQAVRAGAQDYLIKGETDGLTLIRSMIFAIERKRAEKALSADLDLLRAVERSIPFAVSAVDAKGRQIYVNESFCGLVGWAREELLGARAPLPYWPIDDVVSIEARLQSAAGAPSTALPVQVRLRRRDGTMAGARMRVAPLRGEQGEPIGTLCTFEPE